METETDEKAEEAAEEEAEAKGTKEAKKNKLYLGRVVKLKELEVVRPTPVQPVVRGYNTAGFTQRVPPSFIVTRFSPGYTPTTRLMYYWTPKTKSTAMVNVPEDFELNVLSGRRGQEIYTEWDEAVRTKFGSMAQRLTCTIGADPEIFVVNKKGVVPAWTFLGPKEKPNTYVYGGMPRGYGETPQGTVYWDGFQAEFTTPGFLTCLVEMAHCIRSGLQVVDKEAGKASLSIQSVVPVDPEVLAEAKEEHVQFGCAPSQNLYGLRGNTEHGRNVPYRFAGGHIHFGLGDHEKTRIKDIVRALDTVLAVACVSLFAGLDSAVRRRFYGLAGEFRTPPHGLEYRVLSNGWLTHPAIFHLVFDLARAVAGVVTSGFDLGALWKGAQDTTVQVIQDSDVDGARRLLTENEAVFRQILTMCGGGYTGTGQKVAWETWTQGVERLIKNPKDVVGNWSLDNSWDYWLNSVRMFSTAASRGGRV